MTDYSVLIIDDDIWMQRILSKTLASYGFKISHLASNGYDGVGLAVEHLPTIIILDILMPELSGHQTLKILKHIKVTKHIPIIMISALSDMENLGMAVKSGIAGFISKPFTRSTIFDKLVDVFGSEKLEMIGKGLPIDPQELYVNEALIAKKQEELLSNLSASPELETIETKTEEEEDIVLATATSSVQPNILKHYQDDEKKSIESIKKLLLKSKR